MSLFVAGFRRDQLQNGKHETARFPRASENPNREFSRTSHRAKYRGSLDTSAGEFSIVHARKFSGLSSKNPPRSGIGARTKRGADVRYVPRNKKVCKREKLPFAVEARGFICAQMRMREQEATGKEMKREKTTLSAVRRRFIPTCCAAKEQQVSRGREQYKS